MGREAVALSTQYSSAGSFFSSLRASRCTLAFLASVVALAIFGFGEGILVCVGGGDLFRRCPF